MTEDLSKHYHLRGILVAAKKVGQRSQGKHLRLNVSNLIQARAILTLAAPLWITQITQTIIPLTDTFWASRASVEGLAAASLAGALYLGVTTIGQGALTSTQILVSIARGEDNHREVEQLTAASMMFSLVISSLELVVFLFLIFGYSRFLHDALLAGYVQGYSLSLCPSLFASTIFANYRNLWAAKEQTFPLFFVPPMILLISNVLDYFVVHYYSNDLQVLIGIGLATSLSYTITDLLLYLSSVYRQSSSSKNLESIQPSKIRMFERSHLRRLAEYAIPTAIAFGLEVGVLTLFGMMAGFLGSAAIAANQICLAVTSITFSFPVAIGQALATRVGLSVGRKAWDETRVSCLAGLIISSAVMLALASLIIYFRNVIPLIYIKKGDPAYRAIVILLQPLLVVAASFQVADGLQTTAANALRGMRDVRYPLFVCIGCYWLLGVPLATALAFPFATGVVGLWLGLGAGLLVAAGLLVYRLLQMSDRRSIRANLGNP